MSPRAFSIAAWAVALASAAALGAEPEPVVLADGLAAPTGVAVREGPKGGVQVAVAESDAGRVVAYTLLGEVLQSTETLVDGLAEPPSAIAWTQEGSLVVSGPSPALYSQKEDGPFERVAEADVASPPERLADVAVTEGRVFGAGDGALWTSRRVAGRLTNLRLVSPPRSEVAGVAASWRGYVAVLRTSDAERAWEVEFIDPENPSSRAAGLPVQGLIDPVAMSYGAKPRPSEPMLYALESSREDPTRRGVVRIDGGRGGAAATLVLPIAAPRAFALGPDGALYVATGEDDSPGVLLRVAGAF